MSAPPGPPPSHVANGTNGVNGNAANGNGINGDAAKAEAGQNQSGGHLMASSFLSANLPADDPGNPQNWPLYRKLFVSVQGWLHGFVVALGISCFSAGQGPFTKEFGLTNAVPEEYVAAFSLYIFGIVFAPYWTPHLVERIGRSITIFAAVFIGALFNLGAGLSDTVAGVQACRFFAGFFGGATLVSLEGTFADIWSPDWTNTYYAWQGLAAYLGATIGPFVGGYLVNATGGWRWTQYFPVCLALAVLFVGFSMPESYQREIPRRRANAQGKTRAQVIAEQDPPLSGKTLAEMAKVTIIMPAIMFVTQPVVILTSIIMFFTFATTFMWFVAVPAALEPKPPMGPGFNIVMVGKAFLGAFGGSIGGAISVTLIEVITNGFKNKKKQRMDPAEAEFRSVEYRVIPAMIGIVFMTIGLFWVANTVNPNFKPIVPIAGTAFFIWGSAMVTFSIIPYLFDSFAPAGTLGAITSQAVGRLIAAGFLPLVILQDISSSLGPKWGIGLFGFISLAMWPIPVVLFFFGTRWRETSKYSMMKDQ